MKYATQNSSRRTAKLPKERQPQIGSAPMLMPENFGPSAHHPASTAIQTGSDILQPKLTIGAVDDAYEREADAVADQVVRGPLTGAIFEGASGSKNMGGSMLQRKCAACEEEKVQRKVDASIPNIQRKPLAGATQASPKLSQAIAASRGGGQPMDASIRSAMETSFGRDFSTVKVHTGAQAAQLSQSINAKAFTVGSDIYFAHGQYQPQSQSGKHLLAHELTHTVQQGASAATHIQRTPGIDAEDTWNAMVDFKATSVTPAIITRANEAKRRFLLTPPARELLNFFWAKVCEGKDLAACKGKMNVRFVDKDDFIKSPCYYATSVGCFWPQAAGKFPYTVYVLNLPIKTEDEKEAEQKQAEADGNKPRMWGMGDNAVTLQHNDEESDMALTLFHEMLHVKFFNDGVKREKNGTGHGDAWAGEIHPEFAAELTRMTNSLKTVEDEIAAAKAKAAQAKKDAQPPIGGRYQLNAGYTGGPGIGNSFGMTFGADLVFKKASELGLGVRGIYLSPDRLLLGPAASIRVAPGGSAWYFDIDAGVTFQLPINAKTAIADTLAGYGAAGFGRQYEVNGTHISWKIGGHLIISDRYNMELGTGIGGGGTAGITVSH